MIGSSDSGSIVARLSHGAMPGALFCRGIRTMAEIVDAYSHCGVSKYEPVEVVEATMASCGVTRAVLAQHLGEYDNRYLIEIQRRSPAKFACVGLVDVSSPAAADTLREWGATGVLRGTRFPTTVLVESPELWTVAVDAGLIVLLYAPTSVSEFIEPLRRQLDQRPHSRVVLSHFGSPRPFSPPEFAEQESVLTLAEFPNVYYQVSGMKMYCPYPHAEFGPLIERGLAAFGAERLLWGSNFPVVGGRDDYALDLRLLLDGRLPIPREAIPRVGGGNALRLWFEVT